MFRFIKFSLLTISALFSSEIVSTTLQVVCDFQGIVRMDQELAQQQVWGQIGGRLPLPGQSTQEKMPRMANDDVEGTIWEYKCRPKLDGNKESQEVAFEGKFRLEESAVFAVKDNAKIIPPKNEVDAKIKDLKAGKGLDITVDSTPKRIGEFKKISSGKTRIDFDDKEGLNGLMLIWKKEDTKDTWMGTFKQKQDDKSTKEYIVDLRPIQD